MSAKLSLISGMIAAFLAVALGAFGAHALKTRVDASLISIWNTGVTYQFFHALALILLGLWMKQSPGGGVAAMGCFIGGIIIFSGSLYTLVLTGIISFGAVTPIGGVLFLIGWICWLVSVIKK